MKLNLSNERVVNTINALSKLNNKGCICYF